MFEYSICGYTSLFGRYFLCFPSGFILCSISNTKIAKSLDQVPTYENDWAPHRDYVRVLYLGFDVEFTVEDMVDGLGKRGFYTTCGTLYKLLSHEIF